MPVGTPLGSHGTAPPRESQYTQSSDQVVWELRANHALMAWLRKHLDVPLPMRLQATAQSAGEGTLPSEVPTSASALGHVQSVAETSNVSPNTTSGLVQTAIPLGAPC